MLSILIAFLGCEGPEGPAGLTGATGADGKDGADGEKGEDGQNGEDGEDGQDGEDGAEGSLFCLTCHAPAAMDVIEGQFAQAGHSEPYTRFTSTSCAPCHSHEGYVEYGNNGQIDLDEAYTHGSKMTCGTCHSHSNNGEPAVFDTTEGMVPIRFNDPVRLRTGQPDMDFGNNSNVCIRCHQPRRSWSTYDDETGDMVMLTSSHAGPHHGAQATGLMGMGGDHRLTSVSDPAGIGVMAHGTGAGCVSCHMNERNHTFKPVVAACAGCHGDMPDDFDLNGRVTAITAKMETLAGFLVDQEGNAIGRDEEGNWQVIPDSTVHGPLHFEDDEYHPVVGQYDRDVYSAFWNYMTVMEDQSGGVHNPPYMEALLDNAIAVFE